MISLCYVRVTKYMIVLRHEVLSVLDICIALIDLCFFCFFFHTYISSGTIDVDNLDQRVGNRNEAGKWFFRLDVNPVLDLPSKKCSEWFNKQAGITIPVLTPCPCQFNQATLDKRFYVDYNRTLAKRSNDTICAYSIPLVTSRWVQQCCYTEEAGGGWRPVYGPTQGGSPFLIPLAGLPGISDLQAHEYCCQTPLCNLFYQRRPSRDCTGYTLRRRGKYLSLV